MSGTMDTGILLPPQALASLMPMHLILDDDGIIRQVGPTLQKMRADQPLVGQPFLEVFALRRPRGDVPLDRLMTDAGTQLHLAFRAPPCTTLKGMSLGRGAQGGAIVNLSFGISVVEAVAIYGLTVGDFAVTDLAVEMLYLVEAKSAVTAELRKLNHRLQGAKHAAEEQAFTDTLTGLKNRRAMDQVLGRLVDEGHPFGLMHLDLDFFKQVNDSFGHAAGDYVLQQVATILTSETRRHDTVVRFGGDEFVLIFDGLVKTDVLNRIALRIIERLEEPISFNGDTCRISASIGTAISTQYTRPDPETMLHDADMALYRSKRLGRAQASFAGEGDPPLAGLQ